MNSDVTTLTRLLASRKVTSEQLVIIFAQRSKTIGLEYELIGETNFEEALQLARECDKQFQKSGLLMESRGLFLN